MKSSLYFGLTTDLEFLHYSRERHRTMRGRAITTSRYPLMLQHQTGTRSTPRILSQKLLEQVLGFIAHLGQIFLHVGRPIQGRDHRHKLRQVLVLVGLMSDQHHVENDTCRPDVNFLVIHILREDLGSRVGHSARLRAHLMPDCILALLLKRNVEVHDVYVVVRCDQKVLRLDVAMGHVSAVQVSDSLHDLSEKQFRHLFSVVTLRLLCQMVQHLLTFHELHDQVDLFSELVEEVFG